MNFLDQSNRILTVSVVGDQDLTDKLVVEKFKGSDYLSRDFHYDVELLSEDRGISLDDIQGRMMVVWLRLPNGKLRPFTGLVQLFEFVDVNMRGICTYRAKLVPWTDYAKLRRNCRIHLGKMRREQLETVFKDYRHVADWSWQVSGDHRIYTMCVQFNELDWNYINYRLEHDGTPYRFDHHDDGTSSGANTGHTFTVFDTTCSALPIDGDTPEVRFHPDLSTSIQQYAITKWRRHALWGHNTQRVSSYNFKGAAPATQTALSDDFVANVISLESHEYAGNYAFTDREDGERLTRVRMEETDVRRKQMRGHSTNPYLQPGRWFRLTEHPDCSDNPSDNEYVISEVHYEAKNNFLVDPDSKPSFTNTFLCHPRQVPWRPGRGLASTPNIVTTVQTATVVSSKLFAPSGMVDVDEFGRVLVRFHWDIEGMYTCRVRVQAPWAGGEKGFAFYPRVGSEVVVAFEMGNPDSPVIQGSIANTDRMPPWRLPSQSHVSGIRSRENTKSGNSPGRGGNHMLMSDAPGQVHWQAFSSHQYSQVGLGFISYIDGTTGVTRARGQGLEGRTDGHMAWRAALGIFQTTDARIGALSHVTDIKEAAERLTNAQDLHQSLADAAQTAGAHDANDQTPVVKALQRQTTELKGSGGNERLGEFPEFKAPHILTSSAAGIETVAEGSTHLASNEHTAFTSGGHTSISAGKSFLASVGGAIRFFAYKAGIKLVSATADIDMQSLKASINALAKLNITMKADCIEINANTRLSLSGGGSNITLSAGSILQQTSGSWVAHAASFDKNGPASVGTPTLPQPMTLPLGQVDVLRHYAREAAEYTPQGAKQNPVTLLDVDIGSHPSTLDGSGFTSVAPVPIGGAEVTYERKPQDPWEDGSYLGEETWPATDLPEADPTESAKPETPPVAEPPAASKATNSPASGAGTSAAALAQAAVDAASGKTTSSAVSELSKQVPSAQALMQKASGIASPTQSVTALPSLGAGPLFAPPPPIDWTRPVPLPSPPHPGTLPVTPAALAAALS